MENINEIRVDKFLWAVRMFKTRSKATEACAAGKVIVNKNEVKPAKSVKAGDIISVRMDIITKTIKIKELLKNRVSAPNVATYIEDMTPKEEYDKLTIRKDEFEWRDRGIGRPTKRDRRSIIRFKND